MDLNNLRIFIEVARSGSFAAVARNRNIDPSSVSRAIAALEHELGLRLFQRSTRRIALSEAGNLYFGRIEALVDELDHARDEALAVSASPVGTLRLTASVAFGHKCIVPLLPEFRALFPDLKLELLLSDTILDLVSERIDLAVRLGPSIDIGMFGIKLFNTRYRVCVSPTYLKQAQPLHVPDDLRNHKCLLFTLPNFRSRWLFRDRNGMVNEVPIDGDVVISNALTLRDCAIAGMGPVLLANWLIDKDITQGQLIDVFPNYYVTATDFETAVWLLYPSRVYLPNKVRTMVDFLRRKYQN
ncbi:MULTISPECIES: LysR substrate-binding domain-containing protein [unclassified Anabaena]|uniref:LysR family transcriptional regulator n=1 Tax=unclassified Anabaena TaxID=2619674 RepID=UPI0039C5EE12